MKASELIIKLLLLIIKNGDHHVFYHDDQIKIEIAEIENKNNKFFVE
jgi:hypothetical protein